MTGTPGVLHQRPSPVGRPAVREVQRDHRPRAGRPPSSSRNQRPGSARISQLRCEAGSATRLPALRCTLPHRLTCRIVRAEVAACAGAGAVSVTRCCWRSGCTWTCCCCSAVLLHGAAGRLRVAEGEETIGVETIDPETARQLLAELDQAGQEQEEAGEEAGGEGAGGDQGPRPGGAAAPAAPPRGAPAGRQIRRRGRQQGREGDEEAGALRRSRRRAPRCWPCAPSARGDVGATHAARRGAGTRRPPARAGAAPRPRGPSGPDPGDPRSRRDPPAAARAAPRAPTDPAETAGAGKAIRPARCRSRPAPRSWRRPSAAAPRITCPTSTTAPTPR